MKNESKTGSITLHSINRQRQSRRIFPEQSMGATSTTLMRSHPTPQQHQDDPRREERRAHLSSILDEALSLSIGYTGLDDIAGDSLNGNDTAAGKPPQ
jgi:hypothetical protein